MFIRKAAALILAVLSVICSALTLGGCHTPETRNFFAADAVCTITLYKGDADALSGAVELCNELANKLNCKSEDSEIAKLNKEGFLKNPDKDVLSVIERGLYFSRLKDGVFDISVKLLTDLWDFKNATVPAELSISKALKTVGYENVSLNGGIITLKNGAQIDLGAIAKGYIAERVEQYLRDRGVTSAIINLGGNVTLIGDNSDKDYKVGIRKPFTEELIASVNAKDTSVVTSGIYQRYFEKDDEIYHHLLSTETGRPIKNDLNSVTIITKSSTDADALSTLGFLLGRDEGTKLIESMPDTEAVWIDKNNEMHLTSGLTIDKNMNIVVTALS